MLSLLFLSIVKYFITFDLSNLTTEATVEINKVAHHINENIRQRENFQKMLSIQNALTGEGAPKILAQVIILQIFINKSLFMMNELQGKEYCMLY